MCLSLNFLSSLFFSWLRRCRWISKLYFNFKVQRLIVYKISKTFWTISWINSLHLEGVSLFNPMTITTRHIHNFTVRKEKNPPKGQKYTSYPVSVLQDRNKCLFSCWPLEAVFETELTENPRTRIMVKISTLYFSLPVCVYESC